MIDVMEDSGIDSGDHNADSGKPNVRKFLFSMLPKQSNFRKKRCFIYIILYFCGKCYTVNVSFKNIHIIKLFNENANFSVKFKE